MKVARKGERAQLRRRLRKMAGLVVPVLQVASFLVNVARLWHEWRH